VVGDESQEGLDINYSQPDVSMETGFYGYEDTHEDRMDSNILENSSSLLGKIQTHYPFFYNTLSVWERDAINSSVCLKSVTAFSGLPPFLETRVSDDPSCSRGGLDPLFIPQTINQDLEDR